MIFVRLGNSSSMHDFKSHVGIGSNSHDLSGDLSIICFISSEVAGANTASCLSVGIRAGWVSIRLDLDWFPDVIPCLIVSILFMENH